MKFFSSLLFVEALLVGSSYARPSPDFAGAFHEPVNPKESPKTWKPTGDRPHHFRLPSLMSCDIPGMKGPVTVHWTLPDIQGALTGASPTGWQDIYFATLHTPQHEVGINFGVVDKAKYKGWKEIQTITITKLSLLTKDHTSELSGVTCRAPVSIDDVCTLKTGKSVPC